MLGIDQKTEPKEPLGTKRRLTKKTWFIIAILMLAILALGIGFAPTITKKYKSMSKVSVCSDATLGEAAGVMGRDKVFELKPIAEKIQNTKDYDRDPNCLYVVLGYYINSYDPDNAKKHLTMLKKVHDPNIGYKAPLGSKVKDIATLESEIEFITIKSAEIKNSIMTVPNQE